MARIHLPAPLRALTESQSDVQAEGITLGDVIEQLESAHPGIRPRLVEEGRLRPGMAAFVDGVQASSLQTKVNPESEIYFSPAISGG